MADLHTVETNVIPAGSITSFRPYSHDEEIADIRKQIVCKYRELFSKKMRSIEVFINNFKGCFSKRPDSSACDVTIEYKSTVEEEALECLANYYNVQYMKYESGKITFGPYPTADKTDRIRKVYSEKDELKKIREKLTPEYQAKIDNEMEQIDSEMKEFMRNFDIVPNECTYYYRDGSIHDEALPSLARYYGVLSITCDRRESHSNFLKITFGPTIENHVRMMKEESEKEIKRLRDLIERENERCAKEVGKVLANKRVQIKECK